MSTKLGAVQVERPLLPPGDHDVKFELAEIIAGQFNRDAIRWIFSADGMVCSRTTGMMISPGTRAGDMANLIVGTELKPGDIFDAADHAGKEFCAVILKDSAGTTTVEILAKK